MRHLQRVDCIGPKLHFRVRQENVNVVRPQIDVVAEKRQVGTRMAGPVEALADMRHAVLEQQPVVLVHVVRRGVRKRALVGADCRYAPAVGGEQEVLGQTEIGVRHGGAVEQVQIGIARRVGQ